MLNSYTFTVKLQNIEYEIFISPLSLHSKVRPDLKPGKISILYLYGNLRDNDYRINLEKEEIPESHKTDSYIINYGQDFGKYYLGSLHVDFDAKRCLQLDGKLGELNDQEAKTLTESLFNPQLSRSVIMFTPTRASDFNLGRI